MQQIPGHKLNGVAVPPNWEFAYGYPQERGNRFIAVWWTPYGDEAMVADGRMSATAEWTIFNDLIALLEQAGHKAITHTLGSSDAEATHVLLLDLEERTVWVASYREAIEWLEETAPAAEVVSLTDKDWTMLQSAVQEAVEHARETMLGKTLCLSCYGIGWVRAEGWPAAGYVPCRRCDGSGLVDAPSGSTAMEVSDESV